MGSSKSKPEIFIHLYKPFYLPGQIVEGSVCISSPKPYPSNRILLKVTGYQKTQWKNSQSQAKKSKKKADNESKTLQITVQSSTVHKKQGMQVGVLKIFQNSSVLNSWQNEHNIHGQYAFPFVFHLPSYVPASFKEQNSKYKANIIYQITCSLISSKRQLGDISETQQLVIKMPKNNETKQINAQMLIRHKTCCCCYSGMSKIGCHFQKSQYFPNQECVAECQIDNYQSNKQIKQVRATLKKITCLKSGKGQQVTFSKIINSSVLSSVKAHEQYLGQHALKIYIQLKNKDSKQTMQPTTNGNIIKNQYILEINPVVSGCCAQKGLHFTVNLNIVQEGLQPKLIQPPPDWNPIVHNLSDLRVNQFSNAKLSVMSNHKY